MFPTSKNSRKKLEFENFLLRYWIFQVGLDFLYHFYQQIFSKLVDFVEKIEN